MQKIIANGTCVSRMRSHWKTSHHGSSMAGPALPGYLCQKLVLCRFHKSLLKGSRLYHEVEKEAVRGVRALAITKDIVEGARASTVKYYSMTSTRQTPRIHRLALRLLMVRHRAIRLRKRKSPVRPLPLQAFAKQAPLLAMFLKQSPEHSPLTPQTLPTLSDQLPAPVESRALPQATTDPRVMRLGSLQCTSLTLACLQTSSFFLRTLNVWLKSNGKRRARQVQHTTRTFAFSMQRSSYDPSGGHLWCPHRATICPKRTRESPQKFQNGHFPLRKLSYKTRSHSKVPQSVGRKPADRSMAAIRLCLPLPVRKPRRAHDRARCRDTVKRAN